MCGFRKLCRRLSCKVVRDAFYRDTISSSAARLQEPLRKRMSPAVLACRFFLNEQTSFHKNDEWQDISAAVCALLYALLAWGSFDLAGRNLVCDSAIQTFAGVVCCRLLHS